MQENISGRFLNTVYFTFKVSIDTVDPERFNGKMQYGHAEMTM